MSNQTLSDQLRKYADFELTQDEISDGAGSLMHSAAAEIERLTAELAKAQDQTKRAEKYLKKMRSENRAWVDDYHALAKKYKANLAELEQAKAAPVSVPEWMLEISRQMNDQPNRITSHPFWQVRCKRRLPTEEGCGEIGFEVVDDEGVVYFSESPQKQLTDWLMENYEEWCREWAKYHNDEAEDWREEFECYFDPKEDEWPDNVRMVYVQEIEEVLSTHLTQADAEWFINRKQHDYPPLYTYVESAYWSPQLRKLQDWLLGLTADNAAPPARAVDERDVLLLEAEGALEVAISICDSVPSNLHNSSVPWEKWLGRGVNCLDDGTHGYAVIRDALERIRHRAQQQGGGQS